MTQLPSESALDHLVRRIERQAQRAQRGVQRSRRAAARVDRLDRLLARSAARIERLDGKGQHEAAERSRLLLIPLTRALEAARRYACLVRFPPLG